jgi:ribose 5-phosphate isomerase B
MTEPRSPSRDEIRALVRQIVDATLAGQPPAATATGSDRAMAGTPAAAGAAVASTDARVGVAIGSDHGGWELKDRIGRQLTEAGYAVHDCGTNGPAAVDYPDIAHAVARLVAEGTCRWGIVLDGAGIGSAMVANKVPGIRAANCHDLSSARNSREHNHANILTLGARFLGEGLALEIVRVWLGTPWGPGRHAERVEKISQIERTYETGPPGRSG